MGNWKKFKKLSGAERKTQAAWSRLSHFFMKGVNPTETLPKPWEFWKNDC